MKCNSIEEYSIRYIDNELDPGEISEFSGHLRKCKSCSATFKTIKGNYSKAAFEDTRRISVSKKVMSTIDRTLYEGNRKKHVKKRIIAAVVLGVLLVTATINAQSIYKTYEELARLVYVERERIIGNLRERNERNRLKDDEEHVSTIYAKYSEQIEQKIGFLKTGELARLEFDEKGDTFSVIVAKGENGDFVSYGFEKHEIFYNDYSRQFFRIPLQNMNAGIVEEHYDSPEELVDAGEIVALPEYIPEGFRLMECFRSLNASNMKGTTSLKYGVDEDNWFAIKFISSRIGEGPDGPGELLTIGARQAFYSEQEINDKPARQVLIYMGDGVRFPVLGILSNSLEKVELIKVAENLKIYNEKANQLVDLEYFVNINDERILEYADEYIQKIKTGKAEFTFKIDDHTEFYKRAPNDTYYIHYRNVKYNDISGMLYHPPRLDSKILEEYDLESVQILGTPYRAGKREHYAFSKGNSKIRLIIEGLGSVSNYGSTVDALINNIFTSYATNEYRPIYSESGHLIYFLQKENYNELRTVYENDGTLYRYIYVLSDDLVKGSESVREFVRNF